MSYENDFISDEELNAFLDDQLDTRERDRVLDAMHRDSTISRRMNELRLLRDMVQHAYEQLPGKEQADRAGIPQGRRGVYTRWAMAACLVLCFGVILGWYGHERVSPIQQVAVAEQAQHNANIIIHLNSADSERINAALERAAQHVAMNRAEQRAYNVEVIANGEGLNLVREDVSHYAERIRQLADVDSNVKFLACAKAIRRLQEKGVEVELLPEVGVAPSALDQIILRMQDDWQYIKA